MTKQALTEDKYIAELNKQLRQHENYQEGMAFLPYPEGATGQAMTGYSTAGPFQLMGIYAQVAHKVDESFFLKDTVI